MAVSGTRREVLDQLAAELGGAVGATRAAVDSGWIPYAQQIGQTGKIVKPSLYLALGISGAIQHKVGMQTAGAIVAVNRDPDAPMADFADLYVIGDLFDLRPLPRIPVPRDRHYHRRNQQNHDHRRNEVKSRGSRGGSRRLRSGLGSSFRTWCRIIRWAPRNGRSPVSNS